MVLQSTHYSCQIAMHCVLKGEKMNYYANILVKLINFRSQVTDNKTGIT